MIRLCLLEGKLCECCPNFDAETRTIKVNEFNPEINFAIHEIHCVNEGQCRAMLTYLKERRENND